MFSEEKFLIEPGDIFRVPASGLGKKMSQMVLPISEYYHFGLIFEAFEDDYIILESTPKGVNVGMLSWYLNKPGDIISVLRADVDKDLRQAAPFALIPYARSGYGYWQFGKLIWDGIKIWLRERRIRKIHYTEFQDFLDSDSPICTRAVEIAYLAVGAPIIDPNYPAIPAAFEDAINKGILKEIYYIKWEE